jgi:hypothetical protein
MRGQVLSFLLVIAGTVGSRASATPLLNSDNGHYYDMVVPESGITWTDAKAAAENSTFNGVSGNLATFSSQSEFDFVTTNFPRSFTWIGLTDEAVEGQFQWVTGEPVNYTRWGLIEPNNSADGGGEDYTFYQFGTLNEAGDQGWAWVDYQNLSQIVAGPAIGYAVEYVPEPASGMMVLSAVLCGLCQRRRRSTSSSILTHC